MLKATTIQERLWELRKDKGLNLEELAQQTGISKSALASYEANDNKEINHGNLITLADFYEVSLDYLFCRTENREQINTPLMELHLNDEMVALLKSGRINNRLLCEIATNDKFEQLMTDTEIYIDGHATSTFRTLYESLEEQRQTIIQKYKQAEDDFYSKTILAAEVKEEDFFCHVTHKTWDAILHDIRKAHEHDIDSTPDYSAAKKVAMDIRKAIQSSGDYLGKVWAVIFNIGYHICGKTCGNPQVLFPHIALNQRMPEGFIAYVHLSSCLPPGSGVPVPIITKFLLFHKHFLTQSPVPSGLCFSFLFLITST